MEAFSGIKYKLSKSEKFEEFLKAMGVGFMIRKLANTASPVIELVITGEDYSLKSSSSFKSSTVDFKIGEEFDQQLQDGRVVKTTITLEDSKLIEIQKGDKPVKIIREFSSDEVKMTLMVEGVVCTRIYKRID